MATKKSKKSLQFERHHREYIDGEFPLAYPDEILEHYYEFKEGHNLGDKEMLLVLIDELEFPAIKKLKSAGYKTNLLTLRRIDDYKVGIEIASAKAALIAAHQLRELCTDESVNEAILQAILLATNSMRLEMFNMTMLGVNKDRGQKNATRKSAESKKSENKDRNDEITKLFNAGISTLVLSERYGISDRQIRNIVNPKKSQK